MGRMTDSVRRLRRASGTFIGLTGALAALAAHAQQAPTPAASADPAQQTQQPAEVLVTGSRIPVPANVSATSPLTVVTSQDFQLQGQTDVSSMMNLLPQTVIASGVDYGNQSGLLSATGGFATLDLRGLGPQRTLVLVDGRRLGVGDPSTANPNPAPDIDQIPAALIDRVEVVTGGASAVYGSDAIAGVVNFILKKNFQGVEVDGQYSGFEHNQHDTYIQGVEATNGPYWAATTPPTGSVFDGHAKDLSIIMGTNFAGGAGNLTGYFVIHEQDPVTGGARDFSACEAVTNSLLGAPMASGYDCLGTTNSNLFQPTGPAPGAQNQYSVAGNQLLPWPQAGSVPPAVFNYNAYQYLQRQDKRLQGGFMAHEDLSDALQPYLEVSFMDDRSDGVAAPSGLFQGLNPLTPDGNYLVNCSNPLLSAQEQSILCTPAQIKADAANPGSASADVAIGRRNIEGGGRLSEFEHTNYRAVAGSKGALSDAWNYDAYLSYYYVTAFSSNLNYLNYQSIANALQVTTNSAGKPVCISGKSCVPYDIFTQGGVTPAQLSYLYTPGTSDGNNTEQIAHADVEGDLGKYGLRSPLARDAAAVDVGYEYRKDSVTFAPDGAELGGLLAGFVGASVPTNASEHVSEGFAEVRVPIVQRAAGIYDLTADTGYRYSDYNITGTTNTYKFEVQYAPIEDARLRFSYDRAVRAPNLIELFNAPSIGQESAVGVDPCAPTLVGGAVVPAADSFAQCAHTGVTAAQYGNGGTTNTIPQCVSGQCSEVIEGNSALKPEVANTWSLGLTLTPSALPGFTSSIDYYHIDLQGEVGSVPLGVILNNCLNSGDALDCSQIVRSPTGALTGASVAGGGYILQQELNLGTALVSGIDVQMNYRWEIPRGWGALTASLMGSWTQHDISTPYPGGVAYDCAGLFGATCDNGSVIPSWRHNLRVSWETPWPVLLSAQWRFIGPSSFDNNSSNPYLQYLEEGSYDPLNARIPGYSYIDLAAVWHATRHLELRAGVNNVFDKDPPFLPQADITGQAGTPNTFPTYDLLGRQIFAAFTARF